MADTKEYLKKINSGVSIRAGGTHLYPEQKEEEKSWRRKSSFTVRRVDRSPKRPGRLMVTAPFMWMFGKTVISLKKCSNFPMARVRCRLLLRVKMWILVLGEHEAFSGPSAMGT